MIQDGRVWCQRLLPWPDQVRRSWFGKPVILQNHCYKSSEVKFFITPLLSRVAQDSKASEVAKNKRRMYEVNGDIT